MAPTDGKTTVPAFGGRAHAPPEEGSAPPHGGNPPPHGPGSPPLEQPSEGSCRTESRAELGEALEFRLHRADGVPQPADRLSRRFAEIWTRNSVYVLDSSLCCLRVYEPQSGEQELDHPFVGSRLTGGQRNEEQAVVISYPLPERGAAAVFESLRGGKRMFSRTSAVERVVLHSSVIAISDGQGAPSWEVITGSA